MKAGVDPDEDLRRAPHLFHFDYTHFAYLTYIVYDRKMG